MIDKFFTLPIPKKEKAAQARVFPENAAAPPLMKIWKKETNKTLTADLAHLRSRVACKLFNRVKVAVCQRVARDNPCAAAGDDVLAA